MSDVPFLKLTARAPENRPKPNRKAVFQPSIFRCQLLRESIAVKGIHRSLTSLRVFGRQGHVQPLLSEVVAIQATEKAHGEDGGLLNHSPNLVRVYSHSYHHHCHQQRQYYQHHHHRHHHHHHHHHHHYHHDFHATITVMSIAIITTIVMIIMAIIIIIRLRLKCAMVKSRYIGDGHPTFNRNPYNGYMNPYYWVDDHPLLYGNNGSLDPGSNRIMTSRLPSSTGLRSNPPRWSCSCLEWWKSWWRLQLCTAISKAGGETLSNSWITCGSMEIWLISSAVFSGFFTGVCNILSFTQIQGN